MSDEQEPIASAELPTPAASEPEVDTTTEEAPETPVDIDPESTEADDTDAGETAEAPEPEFVTITGDDGVEYQVPKALDGMFLKNKDYTTKTQTVAEKAKELEQREAAIAQQAEATDAELEARATLKHVKSEMERFEAFDFAQYQQARQTDPMGADEAWAYKQHLKEQHAALEGTLSKATNERTEKAQQDLAKRVQETLEAATKIIPGVTAENRTATIEKLVNFAHSKGISEQVIKANWSPTFLALLHEAQIGSQVIAKQSAARPAAPKAPIAPLATVKTASAPAASRSLADLANGDDMEAYAAARSSGRRR